MVTFKLKANGDKQWFVNFDGILYKCVNQDVATELFKLFTQRAIKVVVKQ